MSLWIGLVVFAQFLNAVVAMVDKYIISSGTIPRPFAYAFFVSLLSALSVFVFFFSWLPPIPFVQFEIPSFANVVLPSVAVLSISLFAGFSFFGALWALFTALKNASASDVLPVSGAASAVGALALSHIWLGATLSPHFLWGFALLVLGTLLISHFQFSWRVAGIALVSGLLFATHFVGIKYLFGIVHFDTAFFWSRLGIAAVALLLLIIPFLRRRALTDCATCTVRSGGALIIGNKILAGIASIMILKAIELGSVSVVQALGGLQFAFLLFFSGALHAVLPRACEEEQRPSRFMYKALAVCIIIAGFFILFF